MTSGSTYLNSDGSAVASVSNSGGGGNGLLVLIVIVFICFAVMLSVGASSKIGSFKAKDDERGARADVETGGLVAATATDEDDDDELAMEHEPDDAEETVPPPPTTTDEVSPPVAPPDNEDSTTTKPDVEPSSSKQPSLITCRQTLDKLVATVSKTTKDSLRDIPVDQRTLDERVALFGCRCLDSPGASTLEERDEFVRLVVDLIRAKIWTHVTYLLTTCATDKALLRKTCQTMVHHMQNDPSFAARDQSSLQLDLLFATLMMYDSAAGTLDSAAIFVGRNTYLVDKGNLGLMLDNYLYMVRLELQNALDHTQVEFGSRNFLRYWQVMLLYKLHGNVYKGNFSQHSIMRTIAVRTRDQCFASHGDSIALTYEIMALQVLLHMVSYYPSMFYNNTHTIKMFARMFLIRVQRTFSDVRSFLPSFLLNQKALPVLDNRLGKLDVMQNKLELNAEYPNRLIISVSNKEIGLMHRSFRHSVTLNRSNAPLPVFAQPLSTICGRVYLGTGLSSLVPHFDYLYAYLLCKKDETVQPNVAVVPRTYLFPFSCDRIAYEAYNSTFDTVPKLRMEGITCVNSFHNFVITNLQLRTEYVPLSNTLANYRGWLVYLTGMFLAKKSPALPYKQFESVALEKSVRDIDYIRTAAKFFDTAVSLYSYALNQVKRDTFILSSQERANRRVYRHNLFNGVANSAINGSYDTEKFWYSGSRSWYDEPIDILSTRTPIELSVSRAEEDLWHIVEESGVTSSLRERVSSLFAKHEQQPSVVLQKRLITMFALTRVALQFNQLSGKPFNLLDDDLLTSKAYDTLSLYVDSKVAFPNLKKDDDASVPMTAVLYERRFVESNVNGERIRVIVSIDQENLDRDKWLDTAVLKASHHLSPLDLLNGDVEAIERKAKAKIEEFSFSWKNVQATEFNSDQPICLHIWYPSMTNVQSSNCDDLSNMRNLVTLRLPYDPIASQFKLFNLVFDDTQYLVVSHADPVAVGSSSKLWYSVCTNEIKLPLGRQHNILLDSRDQKFHTELAQSDRLSVKRAVKSPALRLRDDTPIRDVNDQPIGIEFAYDETVLRRFEYPYHVYYDTPEIFYPLYDVSQ